MLQALLKWIAGACAASVLGSACAHPPPALHSTRLLVENTGGGYLPFVRAKVAGHPILLLFDTGAVRSILPEGFVREHKLWARSVSYADGYQDANGQIVWMPSVPNVPVQFEGEPGGSLDFVMSPSADASWGILAPHHLLRPGSALVIDLGREELRYEEEEAAVKRLAAEAAPLREMDFHRCLIEGFTERSHRVVSITIDGISTELLLDTGASRTVLARNNPALASMLKRKGAYRTTTAIASTGNSLLVEDVPIEVSGTSFVLPVFVSPASQVCGRGALGADVLHHCTLVWGWNSLWAACRTPPARE